LNRKSFKVQSHPKTNATAFLLHHLMLTIFSFLYLFSKTPLLLVGCPGRGVMFLVTGGKGIAAKGQGFRNCLHGSIKRFLCVITCNRLGADCSAIRAQQNPVRRGRGFGLINQCG
jgi:hypothetical protein